MVLFSLEYDIEVYIETKNRCVFVTLQLAGHPL